MTIQTDQRTDVLIGQVQGCPVLARYMDDGKLYEAALTWQGAKVVTDADGYIELFGGRDIAITDWRIVRDLVQCDVMEDLTTLVLAHQWIAPIEGYVAEDEIPDDAPSVSVPDVLTMPSIAELEDQIIGLTLQIIRMQKEPKQ